MSEFSELKDYQKAGVLGLTLMGLGLLSEEGREGFKEGGLSGGIGKAFGVGTKAVLSIPLDFLKGTGEAFGITGAKNGKGLGALDMDKLKGMGLGMFAPTKDVSPTAAPDELPVWLIPLAIAGAAVVVVLMMMR